MKVTEQKLIEGAIHNFSFQMEMRMMDGLAEEKTGWEDWPTAIKDAIRKIDAARDEEDELLKEKLLIDAANYLMMEWYKTASPYSRA